jgi:transcription elongation factor Elf1
MHAFIEWAGQSTGRSMIVVNIFFAFIALLVWAIRRKALELKKKYTCTSCGSVWEIDETIEVTYYHVGPNWLTLSTNFVKVITRRSFTCNVCGARFNGTIETKRKPRAA